MTAAEFIFLNDQPVRVASIRPDDTGGFTFVVIARGGADRDRTIELLHDDKLQVRIGQEDAQPMQTSDIDVRSTGEGPQAIHRIEATLTPNTGIPAAPTDPLLDRLDAIIALLTGIRDELQRDRAR